VPEISFLDCPHKNVQEFSECCLDCGYNIYTTEREYLEDLRRRANRCPEEDEIRKLERELGIQQLK